MSNNKDMVTNILNSIKSILVPVHKEGYKFIVIFGIVTIFLAMLSSTLGLVGIILTLWCVFFFRDPERFIPSGDNLVISPADGIVSKIDNKTTPPEELGLKSKDWIKISVFLNVFNVHVNRVPISGKITKVHYKEGEFLSADLKDASEKNERNSVLLETKDGKNIAFIQVAGLIARRIISDLKEGQKVKSGDRYGIIRFGSRADIYLPKGTNVKVLEGQTMVGGETILAEV
jgi:phosphatidylserine decarboxylase